MEKRRRIALLDEVRGGLIILMVLHHFFYTLGYLFDVPFGRTIFDGIGIFHPIGAGLFIAICGFCCQLSRSNVKRGVWLAAVAAGMTLVLWLVTPENLIWWGILHCLAVCILLYAALSRLLRHVPLWLGLVVCAVGVVLTWHLPPTPAAGLDPCGGYFGLTGIWELPLSAAVTAQTWLYPLGLAFGDSADYFPLLPWMFVFFAGTFLGRLADAAPEWMCRPHCRWLGAIGRNTLWIYVAHQPVLYGLIWLWFRIVG